MKPPRGETDRQKASGLSEGLHRQKEEGHSGGADREERADRPLGDAEAKRCASKLTGSSAGHGSKKTIDDGRVRDPRLQLPEPSRANGRDVANRRENDPVNTHESGGHARNDHQPLVNNEVENEPF